MEKYPQKGSAVQAFSLLLFVSVRPVCILLVCKYLTGNSVDLSVAQKDKQLFLPRAGLRDCLESSLNLKSIEKAWINTLQ